MSDPIGAVVSLDIGPVAAGGSCVARLDGQAVFVRHALPGARVRAVVTEAWARYLRADAVEIAAASPDRVEPPCRYAGPGRCGGCDWQHAALPAQRELKAAVVGEQLRRLGGLVVPVSVEQPPGPPDGLGWRTRVAFAVRADGKVGLRRHRSHVIEPVEGCPIATPGVESIGVERRRWPGVRAVIAVASSLGDRAVIVVPAGRRRRPAVPVDPDVAVLLAPIREGGRVRALRGGSRVRERAAGRSWTVAADGFWQVHPAAPDLLVEAVLGLLAPRPAESVLELYAGAGLFTAALAASVGVGGRVLAVEGAAGSVADACRNLADLTQVEVRRMRISAAALPGEIPRPDLVVLDPPRAGAGIAVCSALARLRPRAVAYVSCDPASVARDVAAFATAGFRLTGLRAFDLFPMTAHVECVARLEPVG